MTERVVAGLGTISSDFGQTNNPSRIPLPLQVTDSSVSPVNFFCNSSCVVFAFQIRFMSFNFTNKLLNDMRWNLPVRFTSHYILMTKKQTYSLKYLRNMWKSIIRKYIKN